MPLKYHRGLRDASRRYPDFAKMSSDVYTLAWEPMRKHLGKKA